MERGQSYKILATHSNTLREKNIISDKYFLTAVCDVLYDNAIVQKA
jgi:hypothetical protein